MIFDRFLNNTGEGITIATGPERDDNLDGFAGELASFGLDFVILTGGRYKTEESAKEDYAKHCIISDLPVPRD